MSFFMTFKPYDHLVKVIIIGDATVGKSSIMARFADDIFDISGAPTIGIDFKIRNIDIDNKKVRLQIIDTAGQERFKSITVSHYRNANCIILMYDVTNKQSYDNIHNWLKTIDGHTTVKPIIYIVGNKCDMSSRVISIEKGKELAQSYNFKFYIIAIKI